MVGAGPNNPNGRKKNLPKLKRVQKQQFKKSRNLSTVSIIEKVNQNIPSIVEKVYEATLHKQQTKLLSDKPHEESVKVKVVAGTRQARMGKHGVMIQPSRINKKKVKKLLKRQGLLKKIVEQVKDADIEMK